MSRPRGLARRAAGLDVVGLAPQPGGGPLPLGGPAVDLVGEEPEQVGAGAALAPDVVGEQRDAHRPTLAAGTQGQLADPVALEVQGGGLGPGHAPGAGRRAP